MNKLSYNLREVKPFSFVYEIPGALPSEICEDMITRFESNPDQHYQGKVGQSGKHEQSIKKSTDLRISGRQDWSDVDHGLFQSVSTALERLSVEHPFFASNSFFDSGYNMQRTGSGEAFHWHVDSGPGEFSQRQLVAIWYLNNSPPRGGETEFFFQQLKITPEVGKLILFPPFWTHVHRGVTVTEGYKYIATTWISFKQ